MRDIKKGFLVTIAVKPIIDATWNYNWVDINLLKLIGALVPLFFLWHSLYRRENIFKFPLSVFWILYVYDTAWISLLVGLENQSILSGTDYFLRIFNGFAAFYIFQKHFSNREDFKQLLTAYLVAGIFPLGMGLYQAVTGDVWRVRMTVGLVRNVGIYHDAFSLRSYAYQTLTGVLLYSSYYLKDNRKQSFFLLSLAVGAIVVLYNAYSKAGYIIFAVWAVGWTVLNKKPLLLIALLISLLSFVAIQGGEPIEKIRQVYSKEISYMYHEDYASRQRIFAGRPVIWQNIMHTWQYLSPFYKVFGSGVYTGFHNDFLRMLVNGGYAGLIIYILLLLATFLKILRSLIIKRTPLVTMALLLFTMWIIDTIGLNPGLYPAYQWYVWGFIAIAIKGVSGLDKQDDMPPRTS
jgi:O-antigen ligase